MSKVSCVLILLLLPSFGQDLSGRWSATHTAGGVKRAMLLEFRHANGDLSGVAGIRDDFLWPLRNPKLAEGKLSFELSLPGGASGKFEGVLSGDQASGQLSFEISALSGAFEMKRTGPPTRFPGIAKGSQPDLTSLSDEFTDANALKQWKRFSEAEGRPNRIAQADVRDGHLSIIPSSGAWWAGYHGAYLFKEIEGDFVLTTRLKVTGKGGGEPSGIWTISGLLVRAPAERQENWVYLMTGRGPAEARVVDSKSTVNGINLWDITPAQAGWYELRIARLGPLFLEMCRPDGGDWTLRKRIVRTDLPARLQAGINVTSDFKLSSSMPAAKYNAELFPGRSNSDSLTLFDYVRFQPPPQIESWAGRDWLAISDQELLLLLK